MKVKDISTDLFVEGEANNFRRGIDRSDGGEEGGRSNQYGCYTRSVWQHAARGMMRKGESVAGRGFADRDVLGGKEDYIRAA